MADLSLLDQSVPKLLDAARELPADDIEQLLAAETVGKTRSSAMAGLKSLLAAEELVDPDNAVVEGEDVEPEAAETPEVERTENFVTNCKKGTTLHLGDGRKLAFGEGAEVSAELAAQLREAGLAE